MKNNNILLLPWPTNHFCNDDTYISTYTETMAKTSCDETQSIDVSTILSLSLPKLESTQKHQKLKNKTKKKMNHFVALSNYNLNGNDYLFQSR